MKIRDIGSAPARPRTRNAQRARGDHRSAPTQAGPQVQGRARGPGGLVRSVLLFSPDSAIDGRNEHENADDVGRPAFHGRLSLPDR